MSLLCLTACPRQAAIGPPDAGFTDAGTDGGGRAELFQLSVRYLLADGGLALLSSTDGGKPQIDATRHLELSTSPGIRNYRVRIFDESDRALISDDRAQDSDRQTDYEISLAELLKPGHRYTLVIDAQTGNEITDTSGQPHGEQRFEFQIAGVREKPIPPKSAKRRRHH